MKNVQAYDPTLYCPGYEEPTHDNKPKYLHERIPAHQVLVFDVPLVLSALIIVSGGINGMSLFGLTVFLGLLALACAGLVVMPLHLLKWALHKRLVREEIIEWQRRGWHREGFDADPEMLAEAERRNAKMRARR